MLCLYQGLVFCVPRTQLIDAQKGILHDGQVSDLASWSFSRGYELNDVYTSFCPDQDGNWIIRVYASHYGGLWFQGMTKGDKYNQDYGCFDDERKIWEISSYLYKNKCYDVRGWQTNDPCFKGYLKLYSVNPQGIESFITVNNSYAKYVTDCIPGYYGADCQTAVDLDCNGGGVPSDGINGDANQCHCLNGMTTPFCEDMSSLPEGHQDLQMSIFAGSKLLSTTHKTLSSETIDFQYSYSRIRFHGKINIPQNGFYDFQLNSHSGAKLEIKDVQKFGEIGSDFSCTINGSVTSTMGKTYIERGVKKFSVEFKSGCSLVHQFLDLKWKFYRYHQNRETTPWEYIPRKYLISLA